MSCHDLISDSDIESIYSSRVDEVNFVTSPECETNDKKKSEITLIKDSTTIVEIPIKQEYLRNAPLRSRSEQGKVVVNKLIRLEKDYRGDGLATAFHQNELITYENNQFDEIQLDAAWDGIVVWPKLDFIYFKLEVYEHLLYALWSNFFLSSFNLPIDEKIKVIAKHKTYSLIPDKYLKGLGSWLEAKHINQSFPMYKVIPQGGNND